MGVTRGRLAMREGRMGVIEFEDASGWRGSVFNDEDDALGALLEAALLGGIWGALLEDALLGGIWDSYRYREGRRAVILWPESRMGEVVEL